MPVNYVAHHTASRKKRLSRPNFFRWNGSVLPTVIPQVILASIYAAMLAYVHKHYYPISVSSSLLSYISSIVGFLLVFATNSSYDRYYEGCKLWSTLKANSRNMLRYLWLFIPSTTSGRSNVPQKIEALNLIGAYLYSCKAFLRGELEEGLPLGIALRCLLPNELLDEFLQSSGQHPINMESSASTITLRPNSMELLNSKAKDLPLEVIFTLDSKLKKLTQSNPSRLAILDGSNYSTMAGHLNSMMAILTDLERIATSPIPIAYKLHLVHTKGIYLLALPLTLISDIGYWAVLVQAVVTFTFYGISAIGSEIENPFGHDANDLPLDAICQEIHTEIINMAKKA
ncbi:hypothetical protein DSO57_1022385 [Entomophthora muscae]|uniref:Uncharacterized protein n=1 Tax=Entomophthora muscae TaxID=34485 RepID=A0ACC2UP10_9FUNG|nr:hypothetical protein DSO57_1022385 [Entomophthora muscae]